MSCTERATISHETIKWQRATWMVCAFGKNKKKKYSLIKYTPRKAFAIATSIMATKNKRRQQEEKKNCSTDRSEIKCKAASCKMLYTVSKSMKN